MALAGSAFAQFNGHNTKGDYAMFSGSQPDPGFYLAPLFMKYDADTVRDRNGDKVPTEGELGFDAVSPQFVWVSDKKILGGNYGLLIVPAWRTPRADFTAGLGIFAPTGTYEVGGDNNTGLGMWSYEVFGGTTLYLDQDRTWSFAATAFLKRMGKKRIPTFELAICLPSRAAWGNRFFRVPPTPAWPTMVNGNSQVMISAWTHLEFCYR